MNMNFIRKLPKPKEIKEMYPVDEQIIETKAKNDEEIRKVGRTYLKWMYGITNAFTKKSKQKRLTNGIAESINNHIKTTIKYSYGFENFERFRKRALL